MQIVTARPWARLGWLLLALGCAALCALGCDDGASGSDAGLDAAWDAGDAGGEDGGGDAEIDGGGDGARDAGADGGDAGSDGGADGGDGSTPPLTDCAFPYSQPGEREFTDEMGFTFSVSDFHLRCKIVHEELRAEVFVKAVPVSHERFATSFEVESAYVCRDAVVEKLEDGMAEMGSIGRHNWKSMEVAFDGRRYAFYMGGPCAGARPCTPWPDLMDVRELDSGELIAEGLPAICAGVGERGVPKPLVDMARLGADENEGLPFDMGSTAAEADPDEQPLLALDIYPFFMDVREASWADLALFLNDQGNDCEGRACVALELASLEERDGIWRAMPGAEDLPAVGLSWYGASAYCEWRRLHLPYEYEFEIAASARGTQTYPWGDQAPDCDRAVFADCGLEGPQPPCSRAAGASREGICDLAGNVSEWIIDYYAADFYATCAADPYCYGRNQTESNTMVVRGGSYLDTAHELRAADRDSAAPDITAADRGVRCSAWNPSF
ncbi:MAG: SUMF1/EgtB/PvdO family nonheme iron enzyme [Deltaproteobacteria bacterium]|nr:SUMF1/EgtB/PvdO family nonheme iron enzyme [Deltaproteobacteria bacterium]